MKLVYVIVILLGIVMIVGLVFSIPEMSSVSDMFLGGGVVRIVDEEYGKVCYANDGGKMECFALETKKD